MQKQIAKVMKLEKSNYYFTHLSIINCLLPVKLTNKEIEVLSEFMSLDYTADTDRFSTSGKRKVRQALELTHQGLANYMKSLYNKGFLTKKGEGTEILPLLKPSYQQQVYMIKLENVDA